MVNPQQHSTFGNAKPKPSSVVGKPNPQPQQVHFHDNYPSPDNPPQIVNKSCHLNVTEKNVKLTPRAQLAHNDAKVTSLGSLLGVPVKLPNGFAEQNQQSNLHTQEDLLISKLAFWVPCMGNRA